MRKPSYLRFLSFCFAITLIAELNSTYTTKALPLGLYKIEEKNPIDSKIMAISVSILPFFIFVYSYARKIINLNKLSMTSTSDGKDDFVISYIISSIINGLIFYYSFKIKPFGWIGLGIKVIIRGLLFGFVVCLSQSLVGRKKKFDDYLEKSIKASIFHSVFPYIYYLILVLDENETIQNT